MIRRFLALCALALATPIAAQVVTVTAPLPDKSGDGHVTVSSMAAQLGVPKGTVLTRCDTSLTYVGPKSTCTAVYPPLPDAPLIDSPVRLVDGANKNGVFKLTGLPGRVLVRSAYRVIETTPTTVASGTVIDGINADDIQRGGICLRGQLSNITVRNSSFRFRATPQVSPNLPACMEVGDKAGSHIAGLLVQNVTCEGFQMTMAPDRYWNGDGPTFETNVSGLVLDNVTSRNSTDGCFDIKPIARATRIEAEGCKRNVRIRTGLDAQQVTSITPVKRGGSGAMTHFWIHGSNTKPTVVHIGKLIVRSTNAAPIFTIEDGAAHVTVDACDLQVPAGTPFKVGGAKGNVLTLGTGCR